MTSLHTPATFFYFNGKRVACILLACLWVGFLPLSARAQADSTSRQPLPSRSSLSLELDPHLFCSMAIPLVPAIVKSRFPTGV